MENDKAPAATMTLEQVTAALTEAGVNFQLLYFSDAKKPSKRFGARCTEDKFYASEPAGALLHAAAHWLREQKASLEEGKKIFAATEARVASVERLLPNLAQDFVAKPDGTCAQCGTVHPPAEEMAKSLGGLLGALGVQVLPMGKKPKDDEDDEDKEN